METQKKSSLGIWTAVTFLVIGLLGVLLTVQFANGSTWIGVTGGLATVVLSWLGARWVNNRG